MKNNKMKLILIFCFVVVVVVVFLGFYLFGYRCIEVELDSVSSNIYLYNNGKVILETQRVSPCQISPCPVEIGKNKVIIDFSDNNMNYIYDFLNKFFEKTNSQKISLDYYDLKGKESIIIKSILSNNEDLLNKILGVNYKYHINYTWGGQDNNIYFYDDVVAVIWKSDKFSCFDAPCNMPNDSFILNFTDDGMKTIKLFLNDLFINNNNSVILDGNLLTTKQKIILESIVTNDEKKLNIINTNYDD